MEKKEYMSIAAPYREDLTKALTESSNIGGWRAVSVCFTPDKHFREFTEVYVAFLERDVPEKTPKAKAKS